MRKVKVKRFGHVFLNKRTGFAISLLAAITFVLSWVNVIGYAETGGQATMLNTSLTEIGTVGQNVLNKSVSEVDPEETSASRTADNPLDHSEQSGNWQIVRMRVTAYCACPKCCGIYSDGQTACGHKIRPGDAFVAADRNYQFGTEMIVAGYNDGAPVKVLDRGGAIHGNRLDVFFHSHEDALKWGVKYVDVKVRCR